MALPEWVQAALHVLVRDPAANGPKPARLGVVRDEDLLEGELLAVVDVADRRERSPHVRFELRQCRNGERRWGDR
jgi:hypothetical protein